MVEFRRTLNELFIINYEKFCQEMKIILGIYRNKNKIQEINLISINLDALNIFKNNYNKKNNLEKKYNNFN